MATLKKYQNDSGYYIQHSFCEGRHRLHITYQVSPAAQAALEKKGFSDSSKIPKPLLYELVNSGKLFTRSSGVEGQIADRKEPQTSPDQFSQLTPESRKWIALRIAEHPKVTVRVLESRPDGMETEFTNIPERFYNQLLAVAQRVDGTEFIKNLDLSYKKGKGAAQPR